MIRLLHIADVHLDTLFACRPEHQSVLRNAQHDALQRMVDCAISERVNAVLIAGDLFDNDRLTLKTEHVLLRQLRRLDEAGITCVCVSGNHDPGGSRYRSADLSWPDSFHLIKGKRVETIELRDETGETLCRISGAGHIEKEVSDNLAEAFPRSDGAVHVGVLHTMVVSARSADQHDRYAPCSVDDLREKGYNYWALGHIHLRQQVCDRAQAWYSGNLMGRNPRESGPRGGLLVTIDASGAASVEFRPFARLQWMTVVLDDLVSVRTLSDLQMMMEAAIRREQRDEDVREWFVRIDLRGACPLADVLRDERERADLEAIIRESLALRHAEIRVARLTRPIDLDAYTSQTHLLSEVLAVIDELRSSSDASGLRPYLPEQLAGEHSKTYLMDLLESLDYAAAEWLLTDSD